MRRTRWGVLVLVLTMATGAGVRAGGRREQSPPPPEPVPQGSSSQPSQQPSSPPPAPEPAPPAQTPEPKPVPPVHTGLAALVFETVDDFKAFPRRESTWVILGIGAATAGAVHPVDDEVNQHLVGSRAVGRFFAPGKWIGSAAFQGGAAATVYLVGRYLVPHAKDQPSTNKISHLGFDLVRAVIVSQAFTQGMKLVARRDRPTGECCSFPSGHAATTFATASVLERHLGYRGAIPTLLVATYVGASRLHDNRHWASDVAFGAALGISTGWTIVGRHGRDKYAIVPVPTPDGVMMTIARID